ncbi:MAG: AAA family ATPase [Lachnospiraceae bacterium]|nr:AAA family ATPase [Lachnospiraceae bacterium]
MNKQPLFIITGASCVGKSSACDILFQHEKDYIVMESDLLWNDVYNTPDDNYCEYRRLWMRVAANISQAGKPVVLCGCAIPEQFEIHAERDYFIKIHYLAIVCNDSQMEQRLRNGRQITDENWIKSSKDFNTWLINNAKNTNPCITLIDNSSITPEETAKAIDDWIKAVQSV